MEGLEISVLNLSEVLSDSFEFRLDSEFYKKSYLDYNNFLKLKKSDKIGVFAKVSDGDHSKFPDNQKDEIRYLQAKDIKNHFIENNNPVYISKSYFDKNKRSHVKEENVILSIMGSVGDIAITPKGFKPSLANRAVAIIKQIKDINPYYLFSYLSTKYGQLQIERQKNGGVQERINLDVLSKVKIPFVNNSFQNTIENLVVSAHFTRTKSKKQYEEAENLLLQEIGLQDFKPSKEAVNVKSFSESFGTTGRIDAEYYQPKYEQYENLVTGQKHTFIKDEYLHIVKKSKKDKAGYNYIEIGDINVSDGNNNSNYVLKDDLPANAKTLVQKGDILISNVRPYRGAVTIINSEEKDLIVSGAFTVLRKNPNSIYNNQVLQVLLRSSVYKDWLLKFNVGTSYPVIKDNDVLDLPIPFIDIQKQEKVSELIEESFSLKKQSEHLLEVAKRAVEIAIEQNEEKALNYIKTETKE